MTLLRRALTWVTHDWALKLTSLVVAFLLWITVRRDAPGTWQGKVPVRIVNNVADWVLAPPPRPDSVSVMFRGPLGELLRIASERPPVIVPIDRVNDSLLVISLHPSWVRKPPGTDRSIVERLTPDEVRLTFDPVSTRLIPISVGLQGQLAEGYRLVGPPEIEPPFVRASGARRDLLRLDSLRLRPIDLRDRRAYDTIHLMIDTTGTRLMISPRTVRVVIPIQPILVDSAGVPPQPGAPRRFRE